MSGSELFLLHFVNTSRPDEFRPLAPRLWHPGTSSGADTPVCTLMQATPVEASSQRLTVALGIPSRSPFRRSLSPPPQPKSPSAFAGCHLRILQRSGHRRFQPRSSPQTFMVASLRTSSAQRGPHPCAAVPLLNALAPVVARGNTADGRSLLRDIERGRSVLFTGVEEDIRCCRVCPFVLPL